MNHHKDVLIASAKTSCGDFYADAHDSSMLSTTIMGQEVPSKVLMKEEDGIIYAYVSVNETSSTDLRNTAIALYFRAKSEEEFHRCNNKDIYLYQSGSDYLTCERAMQQIGFNNWCNIDGNGYEMWEIFKRVNYVQYDNLSSYQYNASKINSTTYKYAIVKFKISEVGYIDGTLGTVSRNEYVCGGYQSFQIYAFLPNTDMLQPIADIDYHDWVTFKTTYNNSKPNGFFTYNINFNNNNPLDKHRYVKIEYDLYTDFNMDDQESGIYCGTVGESYFVQLSSACTECNSNCAQYYYLDATGATYTGYFPSTCSICQQGKTTNIVISPSDAGTVTLHKDPSNKYVETYDLTIYPNDTGSQRDVEIYTYTEFNDGTTCSTRTGYYAQKALDECDDCSKILNKIKHSGTIDSTPIDCTKELSSWFISQDYAGWFSLNSTPIAYFTSSIDCATAYVVFCDENGENEFLPESSSDSYYYEVCEGSKLKYYSYTIGKGQKLSVGSSSNGTIGYYYNGENVHKIKVSLYYKIKIYKGDSLFCTSDVYKYERGLTVTRTTPICTTPTCENINSTISFDNSATKVNINGIDHVLLPKSGALTLSYQSAFANGSEITGSYYDNLCTGYTQFFSITSTVEGLNASINGTSISVTAPPNTNNEVYDIYTLAVNFKMRDPNGNETSCGDLSQSLYIAVDYQ